MGARPSGLIQDKTSRCHASLKQFTDISLTQTETAGPSGSSYMAVGQHFLLGRIASEKQKRCSNGQRDTYVDHYRQRSMRAG